MVPHQLRPPEYENLHITVEFRDAGELDKVLTKREWEAMVDTLYKRKGKKIHPVNAPLPNGVKPSGEANFEKAVKIAHRPPGDHRDGKVGRKVLRGSRLTPERLAHMKIGGGMLSEEERQLFVDILFEFEGAIAFDDSEMGLLNPEIEPPVTIHTVPHVPWQQQNLRLPRAMQEEATRQVKEKLELGMLEFSQGPYRNRYFLVEKKDKRFRFISDVQQLNKVTIRDSGMPPSVDEFSEDFAGHPITSSIDYYSGYNQIMLDPASRDLTAFLTDLGLVRGTRLPQGWCNSVATFQRIVGKVHCQQIPHEVRLFIDDAGIKGPKTRYNDELVSPGIRRFVAEHAEIFRNFMKNAWEAGLTISGLKSAIGMPGIEIVGMVCDYDGRHPEETKVQKILDWPVPRNIRQARGFVGIVVYYRIFIKGFSTIAEPIFRLFRKGKRFYWGQEQQLAMDALKERLTEAPVLVSLDFSPSALPIILHSDASTTIGWGAILSQKQADGTVRPARFESGIWSDAEKKYDAVKLECRGLLKALKKFRFWLFGRPFTIETDAQTLVWLLNQPPNDLPNAMLTRWLTYIRLFDFEVKHVPGNKNGGADALSRRGHSPYDDFDDSDPEQYFDSRLNATSGDIAHGPPLHHGRIWLLEGEYEGPDLVLGRYLETLQRPEGLSDQEFQQLRRKSKLFLIKDGVLYKRGRKRGMPARRVLGRQEERIETIRSLHDGMGHRGKSTTYDNVARRYQWKGMYEDVANFVKTCLECQKRARKRYEEPLHPTVSRTVWEKVGIDVVHMPWTPEGYRYAVFARDDLSGWTEGRALKENTSQAVAKFLFEDIICRHGCPLKVVMDRGSENKGVAQGLLEKYKIRKIEVSAYHPQANGLVERGHDTIINSLAKYCSQQKGQWVENLPLVLWADRISVRRATGYSAFELLYGRDCLLPIDLSLPSWNMVDWDEVTDKESLIVARMHQLDQRNLHELQASTNLYNSRLSNKYYFDNTKHLRSAAQQLQVGDMVMLHNTIMQHSHSRKLDDNWRGPYRIREIPEDSTFYCIEELDGTPLAAPVTGNRLKRFFMRAELNAQGRAEDATEEEPIREDDGGNEGIDNDGEEENLSGQED
jgi:hypothetical protein